jgi:hypothetical protein
MASPQIEIQEEIGSSLTNNVDDDVNTFSIFNDGEEEVDNADATYDTMVCTDGLPLYAQTIEYVDPNIPIMFTRDQLLFHVLNTITYKSKVDDQAKWIRQANSFVDLLYQQHDHMLYKNLLIRPIVLGHRYQILEEEEYEDESLVEDLLEVNNSVATTMSRLLNRRLVNKSSASYLDHIQHMHKVEQTFKIVADDDIYYIQYRVPYTSNAYVYQKYERSVNELPGANGNHVVFETSNIYSGDVVPVFGFVFKGLNFNSNDNTYEWIDAEEYRDGLKSLRQGDKVYVYPHATQEKLSGRVSSCDSESHYCMIELKNGNTINVHTDHIWNNNEFVYASSNKRRFIMSGIVNEGIAFSLLKGDADGQLTLKTFVPSPSIVALHNKENINDIFSLKQVLQAHGYLPWQYDTVSQNALANVLQGTVVASGSFRQNIIPAFPAFGSHEDLGKMITYDNHNYAAYPVVGQTSDTEYHRLKHLFSQGDAGLIHLLEGLTANVRSTRTRVTKHLGQIDAWINEYQDRDLRAEYDDDGDEECASKTRKYCKVYKTVEDMEADNHKAIEGVKRGDFAQLVLGDKTEDFRRFKGNDGDEIWVKDLASASFPKFKCLNEDRYPLNLQELIKLDCLYDDLNQICRSMAFMKDSVVKTNLQTKFETMLSTRDFVNQVDHYLAELESWKQDVGSFIALVRSIQETAKANNESPAVPKLSKSEIVTHDYTHHIGDAGSFDFEETYGNVDFGDQNAYAVMGGGGIGIALETDEGDDVRDLLGSATTDSKDDGGSSILAMVSAISIATGITMSSRMMKYLAAQAGSSLNDAPGTIEAIDTQLEKRKKTETVLFERNIRKQLAEKKMPVTEAAVAKQRRIFVDQLKKKLATLRETLVSKMKNGQRLVLFNMCAMFVILAQINIGYVRQVNPSCRDRFSEGMGPYVSCVIHKMASRGNSGDGGAFILASNMSLEDVDKLLNETIARVLDQKSSLKIAYETALASAASKELAKQLLDKKPADIDWPSFRPFIKEIHGAIPKANLQQKQTTRRSSSCNVGAIKHIKSSTDDVQFVSKNINIPSKSSIVSVAVDSSKTRKRSVSWEDSNLPKSIVQSVLNNWDLWDEDVIDASLDRFQSSIGLLGIADDTLLQTIFDLYKTKSTEYLLVANNLKTFVCGELRSIIGRLKSKWKLANNDKSSEFDKTIAQLVEKVEASSLVSNLITPKLELLTTSFENVELLNSIVDPVNRLYAYLYMLVYAVSEVTSIVQSDQRANNVKLVVKQRASDIVEFILRAFTQTNEMNTFSAEKIKHSQEALREKSKEDIIARFEAMDEESRRAVLEMKKAGHRTFADLLFELDPAAKESPEIGQDQDGAALEERYEEFTTFAGDNNEMDIDAPFINDDDNDAWESPDD